MTKKIKVTRTYVQVQKALNLALDTLENERISLYNFQKALDSFKGKQHDVLPTHIVSRMPGAVKKRIHEFGMVF